MKKADVKVGVAYACGGTAQYEFRTYKRDVVVEVDGERTVDGTWREEQRKGIVVRFEERAPAMLPEARRVKDSETDVILSVSLLPNVAEELLKKASPADVAGGAVELFVEELERRGFAITRQGPPLDSRGVPEAVSAAKRVAVDATVQGIAPADAEAA